LKFDIVILQNRSRCQ